MYCDFDHGHSWRKITLGGNECRVHELPVSMSMSVAAVPGIALTISDAISVLPREPEQRRRHSPAGPQGRKRVAAVCAGRDFGKHRRIEFLDLEQPHDRASSSDPVLQDLSRNTGLGSQDHVLFGHKSTAMVTRTRWRTQPG